MHPSVLPDVVKADLDIRRLPAKPEAGIKTLSVPARLKRTGLETELLIQGTFGDAPHRGADRSLLRLIGQARRLSELVMNSNGKPVQEHAADTGLSRSYFTRVFRLSFLAPEITKAIIQGRQPRGFNAIALASSRSNGPISAVSLVSTELPAPSNCGHPRSTSDGGSTVPATEAPSMPRSPTANGTTRNPIGDFCQCSTTEPAPKRFLCPRQNGAPALTRGHVGRSSNLGLKARFYELYQYFRWQREISNSRHA